MPRKTEKGHPRSETLGLVSASDADF